MISGFELAKLEREIQRTGIPCNVFRTRKNKYNEDTDETDFICTLKGILHITKGYVTQKDKDSSVTNSKGQPKLLVILEQAKDVKSNDFIFISNKKYRVIEINDIQLFGFVADISLEVVQNEL